MLQRCWHFIAAILISFAVQQGTAHAATISLAIEAQAPGGQVPARTSGSSLTGSLIIDPVLERLTSADLNITSTNPLSSDLLGDPIGNGVFGATSIERSETFGGLLTSIVIESNITSARRVNVQNPAGLSGAEVFTVTALQLSFVGTTNLLGSNGELTAEFFNNNQGQLTFLIDREQPIFNRTIDANLFFNANITATEIAVPLPGGLALLLSGLAVLGCLTPMKRKKMRSA